MGFAISTVQVIHKTHLYFQEQQLQPQFAGLLHQSTTCSFFDIYPSKQILHCRQY